MELLLNQNELLNLDKNLRNLKIVCQSGQCWITQSGDSRDHILYPGQTYRSSSNGRLLILATRESRLKLLQDKQGIDLPVLWNRASCSS